MRKIQWTQEEMALLNNPSLSHMQISTMTGKNYQTIVTTRRRLGVQPTRVVTPAEAAPTTVQEDRAKVDESYWRRRHGDILGKYEKLLEERTVEDRLVSRILEVAPVSYNPLPPVAPRHISSGKAQSAVLMFSDTHIGKNVSPKQTLSFGSYNFAMFQARLKYLEDSILSICENHVNTPIPELVIAMMGDMLDGQLGHSNECAQIDTIFNQFYCGAHVVAQFLRNLAPHFPLIRIYDTVGNHPRFTNQKKMPTKNRYSNFDQFFYALVRELVRDIKNIEWELDMQPYKLFQVQDFHFFIAHGDSLRGGDKNLGIPNHAVGRLISTATQMMNKYGKESPNYYLVGHLHRDIVLPHATGSFMVNGGFPGVDEFALSSMFTPADPTQKFFFVHPQYGKTATYDISLKFAAPDKKNPPYTIPGEFEMV